MRAFIFSLDAFVAFTLALVAIYTLIFFSSIPSSYYYLLTQGHFLARDTLYSVTTSDCLTEQGLLCEENGTSVLDNIAFGTNGNYTITLVNSTIGNAIPNQFGYTLESSEDDGTSWSTLYDTSSANGDSHAKAKKKLSVSSQIPVFEHESKPMKTVNPYQYKTCMGEVAGEGFVITCGGEPQTSIAHDTLVPKAGVRLVKLTIFI